MRHLVHTRPRLTIAALVGLTSGVASAWVLPDTTVTQNLLIGWDLAFGST